MTNGPTTPNQVPYETVLALLIKTREKLVTALYQTIELETLLDEANKTIESLKKSDTAKK
jgi:hypothetical protein